MIQCTLQSYKDRENNLAILSYGNSLYDGSELQNPGQNFHWFHCSRHVTPLRYDRERLVRHWTSAHLVDLSAGQMAGVIDPSCGYRAALRARWPGTGPCHRSLAKLVHIRLAWTFDARRSPDIRTFDGCCGQTWTIPQHVRFSRLHLHAFLPRLLHPACSWRRTGPWTMV
jgi:hypothetical protein